MEWVMKNFKSCAVFAFIFGSLALTCTASFAEQQAKYMYTRTMNGRVVAEIVGDGVIASGDAAALIRRAQGCLVRNGSNGPISSSGALNALTGQSNTASGGAPTIELADSVGGELVGNVQAAFSYMLVGRIARARLIVEAKTDKFRVVLSSPTILYSKKSSDADPVVISPGTGGDQAVQALTAIADKVADCMLETKKEW